jgi:hypothetical protein
VKKSTWTRNGEEKYIFTDEVKDTTDIQGEVLAHCLDMLDFYYAGG